MSRTLLEIPPEKLRVSPHYLFNSQWLLLAAGDFVSGQWNAMTISWGSLGTMWSMPFAQVVVRPQRYTRQFMDSGSTFTLSAFPRTFRAALETMGSRSGRQGDKTALAGLTPVQGSRVAAPVFQEAELVIECQKLFAQDMDAKAFLDERAAGCYPTGDYHRMYFGEILAVQGTSDYVAE